MATYSNNITSSIYDAINSASIFNCPAGKFAEGVVTLVMGGGITQVVVIIGGVSLNLYEANYANRVINIPFYVKGGQGVSISQTNGTIPAIISGQINQTT